MIEEILNLPVIVQGALGSFLFWLSYELSRRIVGLVIKLVSKFNKDIKLEFLLYEQAYSLQEILVKGEDSRDLDSLRLSIFHMALNRALKGIIYVCLGLLTYSLVGEFSKIAYLIAMFYFFRALRSAHIEVLDKHDKEWHVQRVMKLTKELKELKENA